MKVKFLDSGKIQIQFVYENGDNPFIYDMNQEYLTCTTEDEYDTTGETLTFHWGVHNGEGVPGNIGNVTRYHGWRGTTNGMYTNATGVRKIENIRKIKLKSDNDYIERFRITILWSRDLYPDLD